jgi:hypothetical protein
MSNEIQIGNTIPSKDCKHFSKQYCWEDTNGNYLGSYISSRFENGESSTENVRRVNCPDRCPLCNDDIFEDSAYYIHQPGSTRRLCQTRIHTDCQLMYIEKFQVKRGAVVCMVCKQSIGSEDTATKLVLNQEKGHWKNAMQTMHLIDQETNERLNRIVEYGEGEEEEPNDFDLLFPYIGSIIIISGLLLMHYIEFNLPRYKNYVEYKYVYDVPRRNVGGTRKKTRMKGGTIQGKMKTPEEIQKFIDIAINFHKENERMTQPRPFHVILKGNQSDIHQLLQLFHIHTENITIL